MATSFYSEPTNVYQFPLNGRRGLAFLREEKKSGADLSATAYSDAAFGGSWYHDAAIAEANTAQKPSTVVPIR